MSDAIQASEKALIEKSDSDSLTWRGVAAAMSSPLQSLKHVRDGNASKSEILGTALDAAILGGVIDLTMSKIGLGKYFSIPVAGKLTAVEGSGGLLASQAVTHYGILAGLMPALVGGKGVYDHYHQSKLNPSSFPLSEISLSKGGLESAKAGAYLSTETLESISTDKRALRSINFDKIMKGEITNERK